MPESVISVHVFFFFFKNISSFWSPFKVAHVITSVFRGATWGTSESSLSKTWTWHLILYHSVVLPKVIFGVQCWKNTQSPPPRGLQKDKLPRYIQCGMPYGAQQGASGTHFLNKKGPLSWRSCLSSFGWCRTISYNRWHMNMPHRKLIFYSSRCWDVQDQSGGNVSICKFHFLTISSHGMMDEALYGVSKGAKLTVGTLPLGAMNPFPKSPLLIFWS